MKITSYGLLLALLWTGSASAEILITAPPLGNPEMTARLYQPVVDVLIEALEEDVRFIANKNWLDFTKTVTSDTYDLVFSEAHMAAWLMRTAQTGGGLEHEALVRFEGDHQTALYVSNQSTYITLKDLRNKRVCVSPSPGVDAVQLYNLFPNPVVQPVIREVKGGYADILSLLSVGRCDAAVLRRNLVAPESSLRLLQPIKSVPNLLLTVTSRQPIAQKQKALEALADAANQQEWQELLSYYKLEKGFLRSKGEEYRGHDILLDSVWGW